MGHHHHDHHRCHQRHGESYPAAAYPVAPPPAPYGAPVPYGYGAPPPAPYGAPVPYGYGAPDPYGYGAQPSPAPYGAPVPYGYGAPDPYGYGAQQAPYGASGAGFPAVYQQGQLNDALAAEHRHGRNERLGEVGAVTAGAFAMYEAHEVKVDPAHARRHKLEAEAAGAVALGSAGYAYHEHLEKKKSENIVESLGGGSYLGNGSHHEHHHDDHGKKHHHHF